MSHPVKSELKGKRAPVNTNNFISGTLSFISKHYPAVDNYSDEGNRRVALITGATSGIGKAYANEFARQGYDLIITGRRKLIIEMTAEQLHDNYGVSVKVIIADLRIRADVKRLLKVIDFERNIDVLVNNAGYGLMKLFHDDELRNQLEMIDVHVTVPAMLIHKILPSMIESGRGIIINVSSLAAFLPTHTNMMYSGSKRFLVNLSESLSMELSRYGIRVQCLCPGFTRSDFHRRRQMTELWARNRIFTHEPADVVKYSVKCLHRNKVVCIPGFMNRLLMYLLPLVPRKIYFRFARLIQHDPVSIPQPEFHNATVLKQSSRHAGSHGRQSSRKAPDL